MQKLFFGTAMLSIFILFSCNNLQKKADNKEKTTTGIQKSVTTTDAKGEQEQSPVQLADSPRINIASGLATTIDWDNKIIKTASLKIEVSDFKKYSETVYKTVKQYGGYIAQEDQT